MFYNRTKRYLQPILNTYPKVFKYELSKIPFEIYVGDVDYYKNRTFENLLFLKIPFNQGLINATRNIKYYRDEYPLNLTDEYCLVLEVSPEYQDSYEHFMLGEYSKMYTRRQLKEIQIPELIGGKVNLTYCIFIKSQLAYEEYKKVIKNVYDTHHVPLEPNEYDVPPRIKMEFLRGEGNESFVKSICTLRNL